MLQNAQQGPVKQVGSCLPRYFILTLKPARWPWCTPTPQEAACWPCRVVQSTEPPGKQTGGCVSPHFPHRKQLRGFLSSSAHRDTWGAGRWSYSPSFEPCEQLVSLPGVGSTTYHVFWGGGSKAVLCTVPLPGSYPAFLESLVSPRHEGADRKPFPNRLPIPFPHTLTPTEMFCKHTFVAQRQKTILAISKMYTKMHTTPNISHHLCVLTEPKAKYHYSQGSQQTCST